MPIDTRKFVSAFNLIPGLVVENDGGVRMVVIETLVLDHDTETAVHKVYAELGSAAWTLTIEVSNYQSAFTYLGTAGTDTEALAKSNFVATTEDQKGFWSDFRDHLATFEGDTPGIDRHNIGVLTAEEGAFKDYTIQSTCDFCLQIIRSHNQGPWKSVQTNSVACSQSDRENCDGWKVHVSVIGGTLVSVTL